MANQIDSIINSLKEMNEREIVNFTLPFSKLDVGLKPLQAKHVSQINSSLMAGADGSFGMRFSGLVEKLLQDILVLPESATFDDFCLLDYHYLLFKIREKINPKLVVSNEDHKTTVDIPAKLKAFGKLKKAKAQKFGRKGCVVTVDIPSYSRTQRFDKIIEARYKSAGETPDVEKLSNDVFAYTLIRFITQIEVTVDKEPVVFDFKAASPSEQRHLIDSIPNEEYAKIFKAIETLSAPIQTLLETDTEGLVIPLDHTFLINEV